MIKRARLFAAMLVLAGAFGAPDRAHAMPFMCSVAQTFIYNVTEGAPGYDYWAVYWLSHCDN